MEESLTAFFDEYCAARSSHDRDQVLISAQLYTAFYTGPRPDKSVDDWMRSRDKERVVETILHGDRAELQTTDTLTGPKRYHLLRVLDRWRIEKVQRQCVYCGGTGYYPLLKVCKPECTYCAGSGWMDWKD